MSKLVVYMSMSLDGFVAAEGDGPENGLGNGGEPLHAWLTDGNVDPTTHRPEGGMNADVFDTMLATGAVVTGRHTFDWAGRWSGDHHDGVPVFVLTRSVPEEPVYGTATYTSDLAGAVAAAKAASGDRDVMMHGASAVQAALRAGLVDEFVITLVPIVLGGGTSLFDDRPARLELVETLVGEGVLHLRYRVEGAGA